MWHGNVENDIEPCSQLLKMVTIGEQPPTPEWLFISDAGNCCLWP